MISRSFAVSILLAVSLSACVQLEAESVAVVGGIRGLGESEFEDLDSPPFFGVEIVAGAGTAPFDVELGLYYHEEEGSLPATGKTEIAGTELALGVRKVFALAALPLRPYVGIGVSAFYTDRDNQMSPVVGQQGSDFDTGFHARAGLDWMLGKNFFLGGDFRWIQESGFEHGGYDLDGPALTLRAGWSF